MLESLLPLFPINPYLTMYGMPGGTLGISPTDPRIQPFIKVYMYTCIHVDMYICIHACMYIHVYIQYIQYYTVYTVIPLDSKSTESFRGFMSPLTLSWKNINSLLRGFVFLDSQLNVC